MRFDSRMRAQKREIILLIDNFSGHNTTYAPTNIRIVFFKANMTAYVQPLDSGIIMTTKAHYRRQFCLRAVQMDDAGEENIYKLNLLEAIHMLRRAWKAVSAETIKNCWDHTQIQA